MHPGQVSSLLQLTTTTLYVRIDGERKSDKI